MWGRRAILISAIACGGCRQVLGLDDLPDSLAPCAETSFGTGPIQACVAVPAMPLTLTLDTGINTDTSTLCTGTLRDGTPACVIAGDSVAISSVRAIGSRPLVIVAPMTITVTTLLDVSGRDREANATGPAGADPGECGTGVDATYTTDGGGGAGGSFRSTGGDGGNGLADGAGGMPAAAVPSAATLRGGCSGGNGGGPQGDPTGVAGGGGGGAIYLIANASIRLSGPINASGGGGRGALGTTGGGGGGGGSGGMIGLDAPMIMIDDGIAVIANGGGGGEGGAGSGGQTGGAPAPATPNMPAPGGSTGSGDGGNGGNGAAAELAPTAGASGMGTPPAGGGGGGGGAGVVLTRGTVQGGTISPPPS